MNQPIIEASAYIYEDSDGMFNPDLLGDCWPGIQLLTGVKYSGGLTTVLDVKQQQPALGRDSGSAEIICAIST